MSIRRYAMRTIIVSGAIVAVLGGSSVAEATTLGQHVATCAQESLGQRADAPTVTCICGGETMTFANFGAMVEHMKAQSEPSS